jgi:gamma-D-glutamyl-L-lysine dipeptidyl-peptidase
MGKVMGRRMNWLRFFAAAGAALVVATGFGADPSPLSQNDLQDTSTDFLSDMEWRRLPREERRRRARASYIVRFERDGTPSVERLAHYVARHGEINIFDKRLAVFSVDARHVEGTTGSVELSGEVSVARYRTGVEETLRDLGFNVVKNDIQVLPAQEVADKPYGVARFRSTPGDNTACTPTATVRREPRMNSEQVDSVIAGDWVRMLRRARPSDVRGSAPAVLSGNWYLAQTSEGYVGFVLEDEFTPSPQMPQPDVIVTSSSRALPYGTACVFPIGTFLYADDAKPTEFWTYERGNALEGSDLATRLKPAFTAEEVLAGTAHMMGTRYEWGGITDRGVDCSGLTQFVYKLRGAFLPRDAEEQSIVGRIVAFSGEEAIRNSQPGDLIFFVNERGKINHVAVSLGGNRVLHSSGRPGVHETTLDNRGGDDEDGSTSLAARVVWVRRIVAFTPEPR